MVVLESWLSPLPSSDPSSTRPPQLYIPSTSLLSETTPTSPSSPSTSPLSTDPRPPSISSYVPPLSPYISKYRLYKHRLHSQSNPPTPVQQVVEKWVANFLIRTALRPTCSFALLN